MAGKKTTTTTKKKKQVINSRFFGKNQCIAGGRLIDWISVSDYIRVISISGLPVGHREYIGLINSFTKQ